MPNSHPKLTGDALSDAIVDAALCRGTRHHRMDPIPAPPETPRPTFGTVIVYRCEVCGTLRYDRVSTLSGEIFDRSYNHPAWYQDVLQEKHEPRWWRALFFDHLPDEVKLEPETTASVTNIKGRRKRAS